MVVNPHSHYGVTANLKGRSDNQNYYRVNSGFNALSIILLAVS
jgi:hypothetical protein